MSSHFPAKRFIEPKSLLTLSSSSNELCLEIVKSRYDNPLLLQAVSAVEKVVDRAGFRLHTIKNDHPQVFCNCGKKCDKRPLDEVLLAVHLLSPSDRKKIEEKLSEEKGVFRHPTFLAKSKHAIAFYISVKST